MKRVLAWAGAALGALVVVAVAGVLIWSQTGVMAAEPDPLRDVTDDPAIAYADGDAAITMSPADGAASGRGLVFIPGAKVDPAAYANRLASLVTEEGMTVVITRPWFNLAFFDLRPLETFTDLAPEVEAWAVGGHSLGGVRACQLAAGADALVLFASYCATDLSASGLPVLSVSGSEDGLSTPQKIRGAAGELPEDAVFAEIEGASHASFGDYGPQDGDGTAAIGDDEMNAEVERLIASFAGSWG